ncbi:hypothetical protein ILUMI_02781 [Ignelater luminosus]|uniref:Uncharacterized protein n=1 Tax=Ignelater luminosus TaxID=2038154 RepID=A0A8K0GMV4_IGNLU|nr:hypothetical protein ILUMI_02781 [Ignelater luminosus]
MTLLMMNLQIFFIILFVWIQLVLAEDVFENSTDLCSKRCRCNLDDDTLRIDCVDTQMKHTIANWPDHPKNLMATFSHNEITTLETMPGSDAEDIKLVFSYCGIKYLETGLFQSCINIRFLDISHNLLESEQLSSDVFKGPYNNSLYQPIALEYLDLSYNQIHSLQKKVFEHTPNLKYLNLEGNALRVVDHVSCLALSRATQLHVLNLACNRLTELPSDAIKHFPNLTEINLAYNELDFVPIALGFVANSLQILNISNNPIIELEHNTFEGLENLLQLYSNNLTKLGNIRTHSFQSLKHLKILRLSHNKNLTEIDEDAFGKPSELEEVYLNDNSLISLLPNLLPWNQLKVLDISNNQFMCNCDLYNISTSLVDSIRNDKNGPYCLDPRSYISTEIYSLTNETCNIKPIRGQRRGNSPINGNLKVMRITLTTLIIVLIVATSVAMWLGYAKWRTYQRSLHYPFPNQIIYSPVATTEFPRF